MSLLATLFSGLVPARHTRCHLQTLTMVVHKVVQISTGWMLCRSLPAATSQALSRWSAWTGEEHLVKDAWCIRYADTSRQTTWHAWL